MENTVNQEQVPQLRRCTMLAQGLLEKYRAKADPGSIRNSLYGLALLVLATVVSFVGVFGKDRGEVELMTFVMPVAFLAMTGLALWEMRGYWQWKKDQNGFLLGWLQKHAQEQVEIRYVLGYVYQEGVLCPQDSKQAACWYAQADGYPFADNDLGVSYGLGDGVPRDVHKARWLFKNAARSGALFAQENFDALKDAE